MLIYNDKALFSVILGVLLGLGVASFSRNAMLSVAAGALIAAGFDFFGRLKNQEASPAIIHPDSGGHIWFIPIWIIGIVAAVGTGAAYFGWL